MRRVFCVTFRVRVVCASSVVVFETDIPYHPPSPLSGPGSSFGSVRLLCSLARRVRLSARLIRVRLRVVFVRARG